MNPKQKSKVPKAPETTIQKSPPKKEYPYDTNPVVARALHTKVLAGAVYGSAMRQHLGKFVEGEIETSAMLYVRDLFERLAPRDPIEEMLTVQMALTHARVINLSHLANGQTEIEKMRVTHEYADRASNTFRRQMQALADYREPRKQSFTAIKQTNIANQQVVQNHEKLPAKGATNEQGFTTLKTVSTPKALPADACGIGVVADFSGQREAVEMLDGSQDGGRQSPVANERDDAR